MADDKQTLLEAKKQLLEQAKKDGKINQEAIFALIPEVPENAELLDGLYSELAEANIPVDEGETASPAVEFSDEWVAEDEEEIAEESTPSVPTGNAFKNVMYTFNSDCAMKAKPDSGSKNVGSVSAGKKLWVENHDTQWAKVYKKSGAVYVSKSCL